MNRSGISYFEIYNQDKLAIMFADTNSGTKAKRDINLNYDMYYQEEFSPFALISYTDNNHNNLNKTRAGVGIAYLPFMSVNNFPYRHKFSYAVIAENGDYISSFRYKTNGYFKKFGWDITTFILSYTWNVDASFTYKIEKNVNLLYKLYVEDYNGRFNSSSFGVEVIL
jgi:hypothetical protein